MPTYNFKCLTCKRDYEVVRSIREHCENPRPFVCCGTAAERWFVLDGTTAALNNALAGDRNYDGLRAQDGTDISSRSKHRAYMKANNLTMADDYKESWAKAQAKRDAYRTGKPGSGSISRNDIAKVIAQLER